MKIGFLEIKINKDQKKDYFVKLLSTSLMVISLILILGTLFLSNSMMFVLSIVFAQHFGLIQPMEKLNGSQFIILLFTGGFLSTLIYYVFDMIKVDGKQVIKYCIDELKS